MQDAADEWLEAYALSELGKGGKDEDDPPPLRLNYPLAYALATWADYRRGLLPRAGGLDAQDAAWYADMQTLTRRYSWHVARLTDEHRERDLDVDDFGAVAGIERASWTGLIGE